MTDVQPTTTVDQPGAPAGAPPAGASEVAVPDEVIVPEDQVEQSTESVEQPAKVMRIGSMIKQLLEEVRHAPLDDPSRERLKEIYETSVKELASGLSDDLRDELCSLAMPFDAEIPSDAELRVAQAQLVGWLEGLFHGIQATLFAQQMAARQQIEQLVQQRGLPAGMAPGPGQRPPGAPVPGDPADRPGTYLDQRPLTSAP